jgi:hypothetical protein
MTTKNTPSDKGSQEISHHQAKNRITAWRRCNSGDPGVPSVNILRSLAILPIGYSKEIIMNILATVPLRAIRQPRAVLCKILSERTVINHFQYFIKTTDWGKYLCHNVIDKVCLGVIILSIIYFCFRPGAYCTGIVFRIYG